VAERRQRETADQRQTRFRLAFHTTLLMITV
jgi:hypothetical protein